MKPINFTQKILIILIKLSIVVTILLSKSYALYEEKKTLKPKFEYGALYMGVNIGNSLSGTFGVKNTEFGYSSFYVPTRLLQGGAFQGSLGIRLFDALRAEVEYSHTYQGYKVLKSDTLSDTGAYRGITGDYTYEKLTHGLAFNGAIDFKFLSSSLYPYFGGGIGNGKLEMYYIDTELQENGGYGNKYCLDPSPNIEECSLKVDAKFKQFFAGIAYEMVIVPVIFNLEYRAVFGPVVKVYPKHDGHAPSVDESNNGYVYKVGQPKEVMYKNYSIGVGVKIVL